jgi:hypothetical protein
LKLILHIGWLLDGGIDELRKRVMRDRNCFVGQLGTIWSEARDGFQAASEMDQHCDCYVYYLSLMSIIAGETETARAMVSNFVQANPSNLNALRHVTLPIYLTN